MSLLEVLGTAYLKDMEGMARVSRGGSGQDHRTT